MPAMLKPDSYELWLDSKTDPALLKELLTPFPASRMKSYPVSRAVNAPENEGEKLIARVDAEVGTIPSLF